MTSLLLCLLYLKLKTESLSCTPETNIILSINHTSIKKECVSPQKNHRMLKGIIQQNVCKKQKKSFSLFSIPAINIRGNGEKYFIHNRVKTHEISGNKFNKKSTRK